MSQFTPKYDVRKRRLWVWCIAGLVLIGAAFLGARSSFRWLTLLGVGMGGVVLVTELRFGLSALIIASLVVPLEVSTGTEVKLNAATLLVPALFGLWAVDSLLKQRHVWNKSRVNLPLGLFLLAGLLSLLLGNVLWAPDVPKSANFWLVQLAQWSIFVFAAMAFWLTANLQEVHTWLPRLTWFFLCLGGGLAILRILPIVGRWVTHLTTVTLVRPPFWILLFALALGQLLFTRSLTVNQRRFLVAVIISVLYYAFVVQRETVSNWVGIVAAGGVLFWLRFHKIRGVVIAVIIVLLLTGVLFSGLYEFAGGEDEWTESGGSRLVLIKRVIGVTLRNPITGLGPASYRLYANTKPLPYLRMLWLSPQISSHNNYVDLFAHTGLLGLGLFLWLATELGLLGLRLSQRYQDGFAAGYAKGMLAAWGSSLVIMLLADWMLPFVYNIGFEGFPASLLMWLFLGGMVALESGAPELST